jgi:hypothetical protein
MWGHLTLELLHVPGEDEERLGGAVRHHRVRILPAYDGTQLHNSEEARSAADHENRRLATRVTYTSIHMTVLESHAFPQESQS